MRVWVLNRRIVVSIILLIAVVGLITSNTFWKWMYPIGYQTTIQSSARNNGLDPLLVASVIRVESQFDESDVSHAGAIGLMQLMPDTAQWIAIQMQNQGIPLVDAAGTGVNASGTNATSLGADPSGSNATLSGAGTSGTNATTSGVGTSGSNASGSGGTTQGASTSGLPAVSQLASPNLNIQLGTWYIRYLTEQFNGNVVAAIAAYNGGPQRVKEWLADGTWSGKLPDITQIPVGETRHFVDRVFYNYDLYKRIYGGESQWRK